ncbi:CAAX prenyl protease 1 homolog [Ctenocephalides felis]|uniref:CAAX prenyl protease 1 homolog n=2 Tax=Ctenocephalides felis TaxID=7515 RepID=UPI000E6E56C2|nr:CAAX prenyl protease 1 homolog [Ctenocephalides felis]
MSSQKQHYCNLDIVNDRLIYRYVIAFIWFRALFRIYLMMRQMRTYRTAVEIPAPFAAVLDNDIYEIMRQQSIRRAVYLVAKDMYTSALWTAIIQFGWMAGLFEISEIITKTPPTKSDDSIFVNLFFIFLNDLILSILGCPLLYYKALLLDRDHDFNERPLPSYIWDQLRSFLINQFIFLPVCSTALYIIQMEGSYVFIWLWLLIGSTTLFISIVSPSYIDPMLDPYKPLPPSDLRNSIEQMAAKYDFPLVEVYIEKGDGVSTGHGRALLTGVWEYNKIVLYNTKRNAPEGVGCTDEELLAMVCHELGHWKLNHSSGNILLPQLAVLCQVCVFAAMFRHGPLYIAVGFPPGRRPIMVGYVAIMELVMAPINALIQFLFNMRSRRMEFEADQFVKAEGYEIALKTSLIKIQQDMLFFPVNDWLFSVWYFTHPTILQRIENLSSTG